MPFDRISIDPSVCHGQACIKGTRIPVHQIVRMLANNDTVEELLGEYPSLSREDILACLDYAAALTEEQVRKDRCRQTGQIRAPGASVPECRPSNRAAHADRRPSP